MYSERKKKIYVRIKMTIHLTLIHIVRMLSASRRQHVINYIWMFRFISTEWILNERHHKCSYTHWLIDWLFSFLFFYFVPYNDKIQRFEETEEQKPEDAFREVITSCRSLSTYEPNNIKSALPQVITLLISI